MQFFVIFFGGKVSMIDQPLIKHTLLLICLTSVCPNKFLVAFVLTVRLSTFRSDYECFQIELSKNYGQTEWRDDLKSIMLKAGLENQQITFLFVDTQVKYSLITCHSILPVYSNLISSLSHILYCNVVRGMLLHPFFCFVLMCILQ